MTDAPRPFHRRTAPRLAILAVLTLPYAFAFRPLTEIAGPTGTVLAAVPVGLAGYFFGLPAGLTAALGAILLGAALLVPGRGAGWPAAFLSAWPAHLIVLLTGALSGCLKKLAPARLPAEEHFPSYGRFPAWINAATQNLLAAHSLEDVYAYLVAEMASLFAADYACLIRWDPDRNEASLAAATHSAGSHPPEPGLEPGLLALAEDVLREGHALAVVERPGRRRAGHAAALRALPLAARSALCIPLIAGEAEFGVVIVAFRGARTFGAEEVTYAELAGGQIALALWATRQGLGAERRLREANALSRIERALSETEQVGLQTVLQLIVDSARELIPGAEQAILHLLDEEQSILVPRAVAGLFQEPQSKLNLEPGKGVAGQVLASQEVIYVPDVHNDPRFVNRRVPVPFRSLLVAPIQGSERCVGTISLQCSRLNAFIPDEARLLGALGTQAAIAIANAHLLEATRESLKEIDALYRISQSLAASLDPDHLMQDVVELLQRDFGFYHVQIYELDADGNALVASHGSGEIGVRLKELGYRLPVGTGIVGHTAEIGQPFTTNNVEEVIFFVRNPLLPETQSEMTVPIKVDERVLGVLDIQQALPARLTARQMQLMSAVADQLAVALQKAILYTELQASLRQESTTRTQLIQSERLAVVGRLLASVSHELNNPIQAIQNALFLIKEEQNLSDQGRQDLETVLSETRRMAALIDRLRATYRPTRSEDFKPTLLNDVIEDVRALTATHMRHKDIALEFLPDPKLPAVPAIPEQIRQVILNLFMNAIEAMQSGGRLTVTTQNLPRRKKVLLSVTDTGPGIDPDLLPHIFKPFVTDKVTGTGLGLAITHDILQQHQGEIQAENNPQGGATFRVWLPVKGRP